MVRFTLKQLKSKARIRKDGYLEHVLLLATQLPGDVLEISEYHHERIRREYRVDIPKPLLEGPGTELKKILSKLGFKPKTKCGCQKYIGIMNMNGPDWCERNIEKIVGWLRNSAKRVKIPFFAPMAKVLIRRAIQKARTKKQDEPQWMNQSKQIAQNLSGSLPKGSPLPPEHWKRP